MLTRRELMSALASVAAIADTLRPRERASHPGAAPSALADDDGVLLGTAPQARAEGAPWLGAVDVVHLPSPFVDGAKLTYDMTTERSGARYDSTMVLHVHDVDATGFSITALTALLEIEKMPEAMRAFFDDVDVNDVIDPVLRYTIDDNSFQIINLEEMSASLEPVRAAMRRMLLAQGQSADQVERLANMALGPEGVTNNVAGPVAPLINNTGVDLPVGRHTYTIDRPHPMGTIPHAVTLDIQRADPGCVHIHIVMRADPDATREMTLNLVRLQVPEGTDLTTFEAELAVMEIENTETVDAVVDARTGLVQHYRWTSRFWVPGQPARENTREGRLVQAG